MFCDKVQKITEALYRVTEFFPDKEPLKWRLRGDAIEVFDFLLSSENKKEIFGVENILNLIHRIEHVLQLASSFGPYMPSVNFEILRREYLSLGDSLQSQFESRKQELHSLESIKSLLSPSTPDSNGHPPADGDDSNGHSFIDNGHNGHPFRQPADDGEKESKELKELKETEFPIGNSVSKSNGQPILLKERKRKILGLVKENEWISIREISASLTEFGEKSIQRDLLEMVEAGILKKTGDKRWRKYSFV